MTSEDLQRRVDQLEAENQLLNLRLNRIEALLATVEPASDDLVLALA